MNKQTIRVLVFGLALVFALSIVPAAVFAEEGDERTEEETTTTSAPADDKTSDRGERLKTRLQELKQERQEKQQQRLEATKLRICEQRQAKIKAIINRSITRAERQLKLFTTISERVKTFYQEKDRTVTNYDDLVAAVDAAKAKAQAELEVLKDLDAFDCNAEDPKGNAEAFKEALKMINQDLKDFRTAVKNLIVGVKSAQSDKSESEGGEQ